MPNKTQGRSEGQQERLGTQADPSIPKGAGRLLGGGGIELSLENWEQSISIAKERKRKSWGSLSLIPPNFNRTN